MDAAELHSVVVAIQNVDISRYVGAAGYVLLLYDHVLTLDAEVEYIWSAPSSVAKILFLILRYMVPIVLTVETILRSGLPVIPMSDNLGASLSHFKSSLKSQAYTGWLTIFISNFLVLLRIWTTLPYGHRLKAWSIGFFIVAQLTSFAVTTWVIVANMIPVLVFDALFGLCTFSSKPNVVGLWVVGLAFEVVVFLTVCWTTLYLPREFGPDLDVAVTRLFLRDGVIYFIILFALRIANTIIAIVSPVSSLFVVVFLIWAATTTTTSRLIINSRRAAGKAAQQQERLIPTSHDGEHERSSEGCSSRRMELLPRTSLELEDEPEYLKIRLLSNPVN
ncbi:hypothetical protein B0H11DRAFT_2281210 [Mycena galericulata]|nr:hypothetical protein B0H11DRAFT_2281210 [Mycena galericulata]